LQTLVKRQGRKPSAVIKPLGKKLRRVLYQRLAARGVLRAERRRVLGVFSTRSWPAQDPSRKAEVRQQVTQALAGTAAPDERTAALIALLHALKCEHKVVDPRSC
jgi:Golgi phosphoprotein 3 (GPP34)